LLKVPATRTALALGAHTRKVVPAGTPKYGVAPTPGRADWAKTDPLTQRRAARDTDIEVEILVSVML
jgi:hypothetical protein